MTITLYLESFKIQQIIIWLNVYFLTNLYKNWILQTFQNKFTYYLILHSNWPIKPDKAKSTDKIHGSVDTIMCLDNAIRNEDNDDSVYDGYRLLTLWLQMIAIILPKC